MRKLQEIITKDFGEGLCREIMSTLRTIPVDFIYSSNRRLAQSKLMSLKKDKSVLALNMFSLYGNSLLGVDVNLRGKEHIILVEYYVFENSHLVQKVCLYIVKEVE